MMVDTNTKQATIITGIRQWGVADADKEGEEDDGKGEGTRGSDVGIPCLLGKTETTGGFRLDEEGIPDAIKEEAAGRIDARVELGVDVGVMLLCIN